MSTLNNSISGTINTTPIVPFGNLNPGHFDIITYPGLEEAFAVDELSAANFCQLPPYCLIEDKHKYLAGTVNTAA